MSKKIQVVLLEDVAGVGRAGEVADVAEGYARNFLFPGGKAAVASASTRREQAARTQRANLDADAELKKLQALAEQLDGTELVISARVKEDEGEDIYGTVTRQMICRELAAQAKVTCNASTIGLDAPIKRLGSHTVVVRLSPDVETTIRVSVVPEVDVQERRDGE